MWYNDHPFSQGQHDIEEEVFLSLPCTLGEDGVTWIIKQKLTDKEKKLLHKSAIAMDAVQKGLKF